MMDLTRFKSRIRNEYREVDCSICLEGITEQTSVSMSQCPHLIHLQCMKDYISNGIQGSCHVCPMCRKEFDSQETSYRINWVEDMDNFIHVSSSTHQEVPIDESLIDIEEGRTECHGGPFRRSTRNRRPIDRFMFN